jgi:hypothetical protein
VSIWPLLRCDGARAALLDFYLKKRIVLTRSRRSWPGAGNGFVGHRISVWVSPLAETMAAFLAETGAERVAARSNWRFRGVLSPGDGEAVTDGGFGQRFPDMA